MHGGSRIATAVWWLLGWSPAPAPGVPGANAGLCLPTGTDSRPGRSARCEGLSGELTVHKLVTGREIRDESVGCWVSAVDGYFALFDDRAAGTHRVAVGTARAAGDRTHGSAIGLRSG